jgi:hypothetical protein
VQNEQSTSIFNAHIPDVGFKRIRNGIRMVENDTRVPNIKESNKRYMDVRKLKL